MRHILFAIIGAFLCNLSGIAQNDSTATTNCEFLNSVRYKHGKAKIEIEAIVNEVGKVSDKETLKELEKKGQLQSKDFKYALVFRVLGCNRTFYISSRDRSDDALELFKLGGIDTKVKLFCTVYENFKLWDYPYFIIDHVKIE